MIGHRHVQCINGRSADRHNTACGMPRDEGILIQGAYSIRDHHLITSHFTGYGSEIRIFENGNGQGIFLKLYETSAILLYP
jgi:hypothetical protein